MKILGISGSPRKGGCSDILLEKALFGARREGASVEKIILNNLKFSPCQECVNVRKNGTCQIEDDMQRVYSEVEGADGIILASPIFFGSLTAQMKMMIDRFHCLWLAKYVFKTYRWKKEKRGSFICVEASKREDFFENARSIVKNFFATIGAIYEEELFCFGIDSKEMLLKHHDYLERAFQIGKNTSH